MRLLSLLTALFLGTATPVGAEERGAPFRNFDEIAQELNLRPYFTRAQVPERRLKIAILDNGFRFAREEIGKSLPANTTLHAPVVEIPGEEEAHGFYMARILYSLLTLNGADLRYAPLELHLYPAYGYTNLEAAIRDVIAREVDLVLYSQTWEYGGNYDGRGFINALVDRALDHGVLWINNAGNFGATTFNSPVKTGRDDWLELPGANSSVEVRCETNPTGKCPLRAVLSWNSFSDDVEEGTDKDLDLVLTDDTLAILRSSNLRQKKNPAPNEPGVSKYPREIVTMELTPGLYFFRVKNRSRNFGAQDKLRLTVSGDFLTMKDADVNESLLPPADNPRVIAVGALDSERSSRSKLLGKPELATNSLVRLNAKEAYKGTSNSAAMVAAGAAILLSLDPEMDRARLLRETRQPLPGAEIGQGYSLEQLGFSPTGSGCFLPIEYREVAPHVHWALSHNGVLVATSAGPKVMYDYDPIRILPGVYRRFPEDILVITPQGPGVFARSGLWNLPPSYVELVEIPWGQRICGREGGRFRLP